MMLGKSGRYIGGLLLFVGLLFFTLILSGFLSGFLSHSFAQSAVSKIVNYTVQQDQLTSVITPVNTSKLISTVTPALNSKISYINCGMGCLASSFIKSSTGINIPMNNVDIYHYELLSIALAIIGIILIFFSYQKEKKLTAIGRSVISMAIISLVIFYIPFAYIVPFLLSFSVSSFSLKIPSSIFSTFTGTLLFMDIAFIIIGAILLITAAIITRFRKNPVQSTGTKLIITQK
ncbi:MAG: hypothetical protein BJBARM4_0349 [Candidatus Parvarchaeum acidiphilum ARMAN-4]|uniref:Uncharacterized protein n=1 Tax=Candidatus Parvarchaeum acidiphilum ARMAN-4 TaxID=662760 RepID=D2EF40_PARA4|nr:MAG: hypothetical protein BJBARM4_0349 [Candidatus Parvarchaeum acidiphilum ARMAN-4]